MIIKLNDGLKESLFEYLKEEAEINLFILGDVELLGFSNEAQEVYAELDKDMSYRAVLLRYKSHFIFYSKTLEYNAKCFADIIRSCPEKSDLSGKRDILGTLLNELTYKKIREQYFAKLTSKEELFKLKSTYTIEIPRIEDAEELYTLRGKIAEFKDFTTTLDSVRDGLKGDMGRHYIIRLDGKIVATASTSVESSLSAMVGGVMTDPAHRKKGLASACVYKLCEDLLNDEKSLCLFYDNPKAGSIYKALGFKEIGEWSSIFF